MNNFAFVARSNFLRFRLKLLKVMLDDVALSRFFFHFLTVCLQLITCLVFLLLVYQIVIVVVLLVFFDLFGDVVRRNRAAASLTYLCATGSFPLSLLFTLVRQLLTFLVFLAVCSI